MGDKKQKVKKEFKTPEKKKEMSFSEKQSGHLFSLACAG